MMPYRPFNSQSRVEFIKKKFENSFSEDNDVGTQKQTSGTVRQEAKFIQELKDLNLSKKAVKLKTETNNENNDEVCKNEGKAFVKRSPAFRKEKLGCARSLNKLSHQQKPETLNKHETQNENAKEKILNSDVNDTNIQKDFKRSKTDSDLLKYSSSNDSEKKIFQNFPPSSEISNTLAGGQISGNETNADVGVLAQYSVVNKKKNNWENKNALHLSESIRRVLQSPLPKGPPPKKPPRTFCHVPQQFTDTNPLTNSTSALSVTNSAPRRTASGTVISNSDIPKLKSKLEKLEKAIKVHEAGVNLSKKHFDKKVDKTLRRVDSDPVQDMPGTDQSCLPISICLNQGAKIHNYKKVCNAKSEFYIDVSKGSPELCDSGKSKGNLTVSPKSDEVPVSINSEAIYDLPCMNRKNSFETFGKCSKYIKEAVNAKKAEDLHYMCTDVINQTPKYPNFFTNDKWKQNVEKENQTEAVSKSCLFPRAFEEKSHTMSKLDNNKKGFKVKDSCGAFEESSEESELDSLSVNSSDSTRLRCKSNSEEENFSKVAAQRKIYLSRVSSKLMSQAPHWKYKNKGSYAHLFECCLVVGLTLCESKQNVPYIKSVFPPDTKPPPLIESLCFPDAAFWPPKSENHQPEDQYYSLVVTNENGERKFGYCRRVLPEGGHVCLPLTYCIISPHRAGGFFYKVLEELESRHGSSGVENFIKQLYESEFPAPGERLKLREILEEATRTSHLASDPYLSSTLIRRPPDARLEEKDLTQLFQHLTLPVFLKVFSSLLHERKVLLLSNSLRNLSSCIEALQSILVPFSWQHTYIPVLPTHLIEMCEAPTPYVMGLLKPGNVEKSLSSVNFEDGILVDLDESKILKCCGDEGSILPLRCVRDLKISLQLAVNTNNTLSESERSVLISDAFIKFFVQMCGNYSKFIIKLPTGERIFQKENFIKSGSSNTKQAFLDWFSETAMFHSFIQDRLQGDDEDALVRLFNRRATEYSEENGKDSTVLLKNYKVINRKVRTLGDKIKDFTAFTK